MEGAARSPAACSQRPEPLRRSGSVAFPRPTDAAEPIPATTESHTIKTTIVPFNSTINGYKQRCSELEEEVAAGMAAAAAQRVEADALRTKVVMLTEACRSLDAQLAELRRRTAADAAARPPALSSPPTADPPKPAEPTNLPPCMGQELSKLLRAACRQLEEARRVGSVLHSRLGTPGAGYNGGKHGFTCV